MTDTELLELGLGQKLRKIREDRGLELSQLATRVGVPEDQLEAFETSRAIPAIGELAKIASILDVSLGHFFQRTIPDRRVEVVRARDRWTVQPQSEAARSLNYRYQALSYSLTDKLMAPFLVEIPPDESRDSPRSTHDGEEFLFVLNGQLEVTVGGDVHRLSPGALAPGRGGFGGTDRGVHRAAAASRPGEPDRPVVRGPLATTLSPGGTPHSPAPGAAPGRCALSRPASPRGRPPRSAAFSPSGPRSPGAPDWQRRR